MWGLAAQGLRVGPGAHLEARQRIVGICRPRMRMPAGMVPTGIQNERSGETASQSPALDHGDRAHRRHCEALAGGRTSPFARWPPLEYKHVLQPRQPTEPRATA